MTARIAMFNHKGGVSKTTTTFNLGWMLASMGKRVVLVDADPQCNLTGLVLGYQGEDEFEEFYKKHEARNIRDGLAPAFESRPEAIKPVQCVEVPGRDGLFLLPGHIRLSEYEVTLGIAQELSSSIQTLQNLPGSMSYLLTATAAEYAADYVILDMNPSLSSINQNLLVTSDYFIVPNSPDYFSLMAIESLATVLPRWAGWAEKAKQSPMLRDSTYPFPQSTPKFLGTITQKFRPRKGAPTEGFQRWIDEINTRVCGRLIPTLQQLNMLLPDAIYDRLPDFRASYSLEQIADFNTLIAKSQEFRTPVFALTDEQLGHVGTVLEADQRKRAEFDENFHALATRIVTLTDAAGT